LHAAGVLGAGVLAGLDAAFNDDLLPVLVMADGVLGAGVPTLAELEAAFKDDLLLAMADRVTLLDEDPIAVDNEDIILVDFVVELEEERGKVGG
jgi:hypothetical protein